MAAGRAGGAARPARMGFSSSRASTHVTPDDTPVASRIAEWEEIDRIIGAMAELDAGIFQVGPDIAQRRATPRLPRSRCGSLRCDYKRPIMFGVLSTKQGDDPDAWDYPDAIHRRHGRAPAAACSARARPRSINAIFSLKSYLPFDVLPAWRPIRALPMAEQKRRLRRSGGAARAGGGRSRDEAARQRRSRAAVRRPPIRASPTTPTCSP